MKRFFKKKWHSIPVALVSALLVLTLVAGGAFAIYTVQSWQSNVTVLEPLVATEIQQPGLGGQVYAGDEIGLGSPNGGKYFIYNMSSQPITVTITVNESNGQMAWYGLKGCYATTGYSGQDTCNYTTPIVDMGSGLDCWSTGPSDASYSCTFELGTVDYVWVSGFDGNTIGTDSSCAKFFVDGVVSDDADPNIPLDFTVTVDRG